jgi:hypothetical protein
MMAFLWMVVDTVIRVVTEDALTASLIIVKLVKMDIF